MLLCEKQSSAIRCKLRGKSCTLRFSLGRVDTFSAARKEIYPADSIETNKIDFLGFFKSLLWLHKQPVSTQAEDEWPFCF